MIGGATSPLFLKSQLNLAGCSTKSQAARIITTRLREELGGINLAQWKAARQVSFKTTILALNVDPGMVCSMTHPDMPGGAGEFRVTSWKLNKDYSIEIAGRTTADEMYDLTVGPKPADVVAEPVPTEQVIDLVPGDVVAFNGQPFAMTVDTSDTKLAVVDVEYAPPAPLGVFAGISGYLDDGERVQALGDHDYAGGPGNGHARFVIPLGDAPGNWRLYLASRSSVYKKPLVPYGNDGATPSRTLSVPARGSDYIPPEPPTLPAAVSASEHVNERVKDANALVSTPIYVTVNLPAGSNAEWVSVWVTAYSGSGYDWVGKWYVGETVKFWRLAPTGSTQWKVKVTTGKGDGENSPDTALESAPFPVAGIGNAAANGITNAAAGAVTYKLSDDGTYTWGISAVTWTLPNAATDVNAWSSALTVQKVNSAGNPATDYEGQEREVVEDDRMGQTVTWPIANWTIPSPSSPYRTFRFRSTLSIGEFGLFSAATAGTLWDRRLVAPTIGVNDGDSIQFTYTLTVNAG